MNATTDPAQGSAAARDRIAARMPDGGASVPEEDWADLVVAGAAVDAWRDLVGRLLARSGE